MGQEGGTERVSTNSIKKKASANSRLRGLSSWRIEVLAHLVVVFLERPSVASATRIVLFPVLVSDLTTALASAVLPALDEALVQVGPDDALVELCAANIFETVQGIVVGVVLDKAEAAWSLLEAIEAHDQTLDFAAL